MIIALSGYARTGKDTVANILVAKYDFERVAFADKLREVLYALNPIVGWGVTMPVYYQDVIDLYGYEAAKDTTFGPEIRRLLQRLGTEAGRRVLGEDVWATALLDGLEVGQNYVITDCRFPNEARAVEAELGLTVRVSRLDIGPVNDHESEISLDDWSFDAYINNDGTLEDLSNAVDAMVDAFSVWS